MNFFDRNPTGQHVSQFVPCPYITPIPIQYLSVMTHTGSFLLKSTGFNIGDCIAITLMLWKHVSSNSVHWKVCFKSLLWLSRDLKVNLFGLQQDT